MSRSGICRGQMRHYGGYMAVCGLVSTLAGLTPAMSQTSEPDVSNNTADQRLLPYEQITVTARKRQETAQDIPIALEAISSADIERYDLSSLEAVAASVPQMSIARASNGSGAQISLRGIGSSFTSIGIEQSVATVVDGVYYGHGRVINEALFDVAQIEILKGPQALFFGKNSTAGVISITTANPTPEFTMQGRAGYEFYGETVFGETVFSGPINDTLGFRVAVKGTKMWDGYVDNLAGPSSYTTVDAVTGAASLHSALPAQDGPRQKQLLTRMTLQWDPTEDFSATLKGTIDLDRTGNPAWNYITFLCPSGNGATAFNPNQPCRRDFVNYMNKVPTDIAAVMPFAKPDGELANTYDSYSFTANLNYRLGNLDLTSVSNFFKNKNVFRIDGDYTSNDQNVNWATERANYEAWSTEFRALTDFDSPINLMAGLYYQETKLDLLQYVAFLGVENSATTPDRRYLAWIKDSGTNGDTVAGFGQVIWDVTPELEFTAGLRYTHETKTSRFNQPYINPNLTFLFVEDQAFGVDQTFNNWSPDFSLSWKPNDDIMTYLAYKTGYKSGGFSNTGIDSVLGGGEGDFTFAPEKAEGVELGVKGTLLDRQLRYDVNVYHYKFSNLQVDFFNATTVSFITTNAGSAKTKGVELSLDYIPHVLPGLRLRGALAYNRARYTDYVAPCYGGQTIAEGCSLIMNGVPHQQLAGTPTTNAPEWTGSLGGDYEVSLSDALRLTFTTDARYSDSYIASAFGNPDVRQPSYVNLDGSIRLSTMDDTWELAVIGRNLTNKFIVMGAHDTVGTGSGTGTNTGVRSDVYGLVGFPRTIQVQATWRY